MKIVTLALNPLDPETWTKHETTDVREFLVKEFSEWPSTARIYHKQVSSATDVTPSTETEIERLGELEGPFFVVVYPADPVTIIYAIVAIVVVAAVVMAAQQPPMPTLRNTQNQSPSNELTERSNKPRPNARIPDIFGTVRSTPDLIAVPYKIFQNNEEVEYSYMCIGRGYYDVPSLEVRDDTTRVVDIAGTSVEIYAPNTSPNSGDAPQLRIGTAINTPVLNVVRSNAVNGQVLRAPNDQNLRGANNIRFAAPNEIQLNPAAGLDFTDKFAAGDSLTVAEAVEYDNYFTETQTIWASYEGYFRFEIPSSTLPTIYQAGKECVLTGAQFSNYDPDGFYSASYDLSGIYQIASIALESQLITPEVGSPYTQYYCRVNLVSPSSINPTWTKFAVFGGYVVNLSISANAAIRLPDGAELYNLSGTYEVLAVSDTVITLSNPASINADWATITTTGYISPILSTTGSKWVGPFVLEKASLTEVFSNFIALNGLYKDDGKNQQRFDVVCEVELTPINPDGSDRGPAETFQATIEGSATFRSTRAVTMKANPTFTGRCKVRARRVTESDLNFEGSVVDEIKWRDVYSVSPVSETHFGNVTTVQSVTYATSGALALKERKLNMLVTRKISVRQHNRPAFADFTSYVGGILTAEFGGVKVTSDGDSYGAFVPVLPIEIGNSVTVSFEIGNEGTATAIRVGVHKGTSFISNDVTVGTGVHTLTFTAIEANSNPKIAFFCAQAGTNFVVKNVLIRGNYSTSTLYATNQADDIFSAVCTDAHIGNRSVNEIDFNSVYDSIEEVANYFGSSKASEFCYTFDSNNLSFEETAKSIADAVFCTAYRRGNIIKLSFEKETEDSTLLFNHRNKLPGSETRTIRFGNQDDFDGVSFEYIDPEDDAQVTFYIPEDRSAVNPKELESLGVRNKLQAYFHAWRTWNKIRFQNAITEFTATQEADLLVNNDRILVADNTRPDTQDGEIISQNVLQLKLSQNVDMSKYPEYTLFVQLSDGTTEAISVTQGSSANQVVLANAPRLPLALDDDFYARTTFILVGNTEPRENAFLVSEKNSQSNFTSVVRAVNYDVRYYANDKDFTTGIINENGEYV